jgi:Inositol hexakisphosphate
MTVQERDFDEFARHIRAAAPSDPLIFNCQLGGGRTTTGTIIGCLVRSFAQDADTATQSETGAGAPNGSQQQAEGIGTCSHCIVELVMPVLHHLA